MAYIYCMYIIRIMSSDVVLLQTYQGLVGGYLTQTTSESVLRIEAQVEREAGSEFMRGCRIKGCRLVDGSIARRVSPPVHD
jgi:hypothetical protein